MRVKFYGVIQDNEGNIVQGASISVYLAGTTNGATIYSSPSGGTGNSNPPQTSSGSDGRVEFWLEPSDYDFGTLFDIKIDYGQTSKTIYNQDIIKWFSGESNKWDGARKYVSTSDPSGGDDGDIWFKYTA